MGAELKAFSFFVLPNNVTGGTAIVLTPAPQSIAAFTISTSGSDLVSLFGTVGWQAVVDQGGQVQKVDVIFEMWRGAVGTGELIFRVIDSAQATNQLGQLFDNLRVTTLKHIDKRFQSSSSSVYTLSARLGTGGASAATVIGPITYFGEAIKNGN
ncbi:hypothetical protein [Paenibacillus soyae]|uniref:Uncharacterized protein n=1 Tax=Paenibacillus soyae TaxID=2969249 RepID=A0A9X2SBT8_9BACL|nr:hypothetical protein [Paenibacillus soyae]MCR2806003.1 hypothetical protein [Paenibacillus soyae]